MPSLGKWISYRCTNCNKSALTTSDYTTHWWKSILITRCLFFFMKNLLFLVPDGLEIIYTFCPWRPVTGDSICVNNHLIVNKYDQYSKLSVTIVQCWHLIPTIINSPLFNLWALVIGIWSIFQWKRNWNISIDTRDDYWRDHPWLLHAQYCIQMPPMIFLLTKRMTWPGILLAYILSHNASQHKIALQFSMWLHFKNSATSCSSQIIGIHMQYDQNKTVN